jgi:hypothetical protein
MSTKNGPHRPYDESSQQAAGRGKAPKTTLGAMAQLRAENEALRHQIVRLQGQWDILRTTLGVLSTTVCSRKTV